MYLNEYLDSTKNREVLLQYFPDWNIVNYCSNGLNSTILFRNSFGDFLFLGGFQNNCSFLVIGGVDDYHCFSLKPITSIESFVKSAIQFAEHNTYTGIIITSVTESVIDYFKKLEFKEMFVIKSKRTGRPNHFLMLEV